MYKFQISWNGTGFKKWQNIKTLCTSCKYAVQFDKCPDFLQIEIYYYKKRKFLDQYSWISDLWLFLDLDFLDLDLDFLDPWILLISFRFPDLIQI